MQNLITKGDAKHPSFKFDATTGVFEVSGRSWPEHVIDIYGPVYNWIEEYSKSPQAKTILKICLEYYNTSSSKAVLELVRKMEILHKTGADVLVQWYHEEDDYDLEEEGESFSTVCDVPFELVAVEEFDFSFE